MFGLLTILAATAPSFLLSPHAGTFCGWAPATWPEPTPLRAAIWHAAFWTVPVLAACRRCSPSGRHDGSRCSA